MAIVQEPLHEWVEAQVLAALDTPELAAASAGNDQQDTADSERSLRQVILEDEARLIRLDDDMADGLLDHDRWSRQTARVSTRLAERRSELAGLVVQGARPRLPDASEIRRQWATRDVSWKQSVLRQVVEKVVIAPHPPVLPPASPRSRRRPPIGTPPDRTSTPPRSGAADYTICNRALLTPESFAQKTLEWGQSQGYHHKVNADEQHETAKQPLNCAKRLLDAHQFWHHCADNYGDPESFRRNLNACIEILRNTTWILQKQKSEIPGFDDWYLAWQERFKQDRIARWIVSSRNRIVKMSDLEVTSQSRCIVILDYDDAATALLQSLPIEQRLDSTPTPEATVKEFTPPVRYTTAEIFAMLGKSSIPRSVLQASLISLERRWEDQALPDHELLDALATAWGQLNLLLREAHGKVGAEYSVRSDEGSGLSDELMTAHGGRLPCMVSTRPYRMKTVSYKDRSDDILKSAHFVPDSAVLRKRAEKRYGPALETPLNWSSPLELLPSYMQRARRVLEVGEDHGWMVFFFKGNKMVYDQILTAADQAAKRVIAQDLGELVALNRFDGVVMIGENWMSSPGEIDREGAPIRPSDSPSRTEALIVQAETSDGLARTLIQPFIRRHFRKVQFGTELDLGVDGLENNFFLPLRRVWRSWKSEVSG